MSTRYLILLLVMPASLADHLAIHAAEPIDVGIASSSWPIPR